MNLGMIVFWAAVGWCGNEVRPKPPYPPPPPPWWSVILGIIGGVIGGWALSRLLPGDDALLRGDLLTTGVGALVGGIVLSSLPSLFGGGRATARGGPADVVLQLPNTSPEAIRNLDTQSLAGVLQSILSDSASEGRINNVILRGGRVRIGGAPGDPWLRTVWRRSGPIRPDEVLINPEIEQNINRLG